MAIHVLFLAAEAEPYVKIGGLGDVAGALPNAIHQVSKDSSPDQQVDIRMVLPYHFAIKQKGFETTLLGKFDVPSKMGLVECQVHAVKKDGVPVYLLDGAPIDDKLPVYSPDPNLDGNKYVFFSIAALKLADFLDWRVDILHSNDWHTAAAIYALDVLDFSSKNLKNTKTYYSLHNLPYMGYGIQQALNNYGLPATEGTSLPEWARHTPLPLGLLHADKIVAVSPNYAKEILTPEFGCGLDEFLKTQKSKILGIINGLDVDLWNPETDTSIPQQYNIESLSLKTVNKRKLQEEFNLAQNDSVPLLTLVSRMDPQKGIDIVIKGMAYCEDSPWQAIFLGTGSPEVEEMARQLEKRYPDHVRSIIDFDAKLAHKLYAGADIFLMPSRYEPCGLSQMIAMRYGTVPIARATGGLADTIRHVSHKVNGGTGFLFDRPFPSVFANTLRRAIRFYQNSEVWQQIQKNGMAIDFSWKNSAQKYIDMYKSLLNE